MLRYFALRNAKTAIDAIRTTKISNVGFAENIAIRAAVSVTQAFFAVEELVEAVR